MKAVLERLAAEDIRHEQKSDFQIKVGPLNFYPDRETIYIDGDEKARPERGLENFLALVARVRARNPRSSECKTVQRTPSDRAKEINLSDVMGDD
jgi:hypothetical protein